MRYLLIATLLILVIFLGQRLVVGLSSERPAQPVDEANKQSQEQEYMAPHPQGQ
jgi:hypothetical protein